MSDTSTLTELANFVGQSRLSSQNALVQRRALSGLTRQYLPRPQRRSVGELLAAVLALSARTRRMLMPRVSVELDVFAPGGARAVRVFNGPRK